MTPLPAETLSLTSCSPCNIGTAFSLTFSSGFWESVTSVKLASYNTSSRDLDFLSLDTATAFGDGSSLRLTGYTCGDFCATLHSCGECTTSEYCGWCGSTGTCLSHSAREAALDASAICPAASYSPPLTCCDECSALVTAADCLGRAGCGFLFDRATPGSMGGHCVSGTPAHTPCDTTGSDLRDAQLLCGL